VAAPGVGWGGLSPPRKFSKACKKIFSIEVKIGVGWAQPTRKEIPDAVSNPNVTVALVGADLNAPIRGGDVTFAIPGVDLNARNDNPDVTIALVGADLNAPIRGGDVTVAIPGADLNARNDNPDVTIALVGAANRIPRAVRQFIPRARRAIRRAHRARIIRQGQLDLFEVLDGLDNRLFNMYRYQIFLGVIQIAVPFGIVMFIFVIIDISGKLDETNIIFSGNTLYNRVN
jgi:hypothetical protein